MNKFKLMKGDNLQLLKELPDNSIDSVVSDPPYALTPHKGAKAGFMGKKWDAEVPSVEFWKEVYRVLKPGGYILSFGGTRTYHRMVVNIEDAGFDIRDQIQWIYSQGFPKSHNIGHKIKEYKGFGTNLKPANEPICVARKPLSEKSVVENVLKWNTGGINIDGCRIGDNINEGRFPANLILDEEAAQMLDEQSGMVGNNWKKNYGEKDYKGKQYDSSTNQCVFGGGYTGNNTYADKGGASRYFYTAKVSKKEKNMGLDGFDFNNNHTTVKPVQLMAYLCRLVTTPNGIVLDPYMGSGSTGIAALLEGFRFVGMEMDEDYFKIAEARINSYEDYREFLDKKKQKI